MVSLVRKTFNSGDLLTVSEAQSIFLMAGGGGMQATMQTWGWLHLNHKATRSGLSVACHM